MGKAIMFMMFMWLAVCIAGNVMQGENSFMKTKLTADITETSDTISVTSTTGFSESGVIMIEDEHIAYSGTSATSFEGSVVRPVIRGAEGTVAVSHDAGVSVSTVPGAMMNSSASYSIATISDSAGVIAFVSVPLAVIALLGSFFFLPLSFLGTDLQILTYLWIIIAVGVLAAIMIQMAGGRRV